MWWTGGADRRDEGTRLRSGEGVRDTKESRRRKEKEPGPSSWVVEGWTRTSPTVEGPVRGLHGDVGVCKCGGGESNKRNGGNDRHHGIQNDLTRITNIGGEQVVLYSRHFYANSDKTSGDVRVATWTRPRLLDE